MTMTTLKLVLFVWAWTCGVLAAVLPGQGEKPGDPNALTTLLACMNATAKILNIPEVSASFKKLGSDANAKLQTESDKGCETEGVATVCTFDYSTVPSDVQSTCESNGGVYDENERQVTCESSDRTVTGTFIIRYTNYPSCYASSCSSSDGERWIADGVEQFEQEVELNTNLICDSQYQIEITVTEAPKAAVSGSCPQNAKGYFTTTTLALLVSALFAVAW